MPLHDWTRVDPCIFHDHHISWVAELQKVLNGGVLPEGYYGLIERHARPSVADVWTLPTRSDRPSPTPEPSPTETHGPRRTLAIRHVSGHRLIALIEILSPANKDRSRHVADFVAKAASALDLGVHLLLVDVFPPGPHDPSGMHGAILRELEESSREAYDVPEDEPATLASYVAGPAVEIYVEHVAFGAPMPEMPLFIRPDRYVNVPLEPTYQAAYGGMPAFWREVLERGPA